ncbi:MAG TPA: YfhO family protein [Vicinamibacteria bacterium]|nr:YfhO family protein [Vicinamibacteria bacterium]
MKRATSALTLAALSLLLHAPVVFGGRAYFERDVEHFLHERLLEFSAALRAGDWPLWNPYPAFGEPLLGVANAQVAYPTTWLALALSPESTHATLVVLHTFLAGLGASLLARELGVSGGGALLAGALWSAGGPVCSAADQANVLVGAATIAWAWLGFARAGRSGRFRDAALTGVAIALALLGGSPESALMGGAGLLLAFAPATGGARRLAWATLVATVVALGLAAVQWLPTAALTLRSGRARMSEASQAEWSNHPLALLQVALPLPYDDMPLNRLARGELFGGREPLLSTFHMGLGATGLALAGLLGPAFRGRRPLIAIGTLGLVLSLGRWSPLWDLAHALPPLAWMRYPSRFAISGTLPIAILAGAGLDALSARGMGARLWLAAASTGALIVAAALLSRPEAGFWRALLVAPEFLGRPWTSSPQLAGVFHDLALSALLAVPVALALVVRAMRDGGVSRSLVVTTALASLLQVVWALRGVNPTLPRSLLGEPPPALDPIPRERPNRTLVLDYTPRLAQAALGREHARLREFDASPEETLRLLRAYPSGSLGRFGAAIESLPLDIPRLRSVEVARWLGTMNAYAATTAFPRLLELGGIQYVLALHDLGLPDRFELLARTPAGGDEVRTYRVRHALPRAFAVTGARVRPGEDPLGLLLDPASAFDPRREVLLENGAPRPPGEGGRVHGLELRYDGVAFETEMSAPGHVVLLEAWDPGWRATVDGLPAPVLRANMVFRAVPVPAGRHVVEMRYRPPEVVAGAALSAATALALALLALRFRRAA